MKHSSRLVETQYYGPNTYKVIIKANKDLRAEVMKEGWTERVVEFVSNMDQRGTVCASIPDKSLVRDVEIFFGGGGGPRSGADSTNRWRVSAFKIFWATTGFAERGPIVQLCHHGCPDYEFLNS
jgi:hypothetical protein